MLKKILKEVYYLKDNVNLTFKLYKIFNFIKKTSTNNLFAIILNRLQILYYIDKLIIIY